MSHFDVVVCGLGAMGSAAVEHLARRGKRVLGIERYRPGHDRGSSHGRTRIIRLGYFEHPSYVPLLRHAYRLWRELEQASGQKLLHITGIAEIGPPQSALVAGTLRCAETHGLRHEVLPAADLMRRFPAFRVPHDLSVSSNRMAGSYKRRRRSSLSSRSRRRQGQKFAAARRSGRSSRARAAYVS